MTPKEELKQRIIAAIDRRAAEITDIGETILHHPELGFKEVKTAALVEEKFRALGLPFRRGLALTGVAAELRGRKKNMQVAIMGELDSVRVPSNPQADPLTGAAHACGHNAMIAGMLGAGMGLLDSGAMAEMDGHVSLLAVPAEELVELEYRQRLRQEGKLFFLAGKQEFIRLGLLDDVDMVLMFHLKEAHPVTKVLVGATHNGVVAKSIRYKGKESHAGGAPHFGINALNAAMMGLMGIHAQRETFRDEDCVRVHPIITKGGELVNVVPADVRLETFVRAKTVEAIQDANRKVNRALKAGAIAIGAEVEITDLPGYLPGIAAPRLDQVFAANMVSLLGEGTVGHAGHQTGSSDIGDVAHLMPALHAYFQAAKGSLHTENFAISDPKLAYLESAKGLALTALDLLWDGAREGLAIKADYHPRYKKEEYLQVWHRLLESD